MFICRLAIHGIRLILARRPKLADGAHLALGTTTLPFPFWLPLLAEILLAGLPELVTEDGI